MYGRMDIEDEQRGLFAHLMEMFYNAMPQKITTVVERKSSIRMEKKPSMRTTYHVSDAEMARRLDAADGVIDGKLDGAPIFTKGCVFIILQQNLCKSVNVSSVSSMFRHALCIM